MDQPSTPTLLLECTTPIEAAAIRSLLQQHGIEAIIQTENVSALMPHLQAIMSPRLLVPAAELTRAEAILEGHLARQTQGEPLEGGVCAVHEGQAVAVCERCGCFLCEQCGSLGEPPVCESCLETEMPLRTPNPLRPSLVLTVALLLAGLVLVLLSRAWSR